MTELLDYAVPIPWKFLKTVPPKKKFVRLIICDSESVCTPFYNVSDLLQPLMGKPMQKMRKITTFSYFALVYPWDFSTRLKMVADIVGRRTNAL